MNARVAEAHTQRSGIDAPAPMSVVGNPRNACIALARESEQHSSRELLSRRRH